MDEVISSAANPTVKHIRKLLENSKFRRQEGVAVAEGIHLVRSYLESGSVPQQYVCAESALHNYEIVELISLLQETDKRLIVVKDSLFESLSDIHASVGILIVFTPPSVQTAPQLTQDAVLLEAVQDPGNLGTILRTAATVGVKDIFLSPGSASAWSPKVLRAGMGAQFSLTIYENVDLLELADKSQVPVAVTSLQTDNTIYDADLTAPMAWVFGNEGQGVSSPLNERAGKRLKIPQADSSVESLNVSAAVAVCLYEQYRQRR